MRTKMKIKHVISTTEIECNAEELRQSNTLADSFVGLLRRCFNDTVPEDCVEEPEEEPEAE